MPRTRSHASLPTPGDRIAGRYVIQRELGRGAMGAVYACRDLRTHEQRAMKWVLPDPARAEEVRARAMREARLASRIGHPCVVRVDDVGEDDAGHLFIVMERLRGETLEERIERGPSSPREVVEVLWEALAGLQAAHEAGVVHRDLKPANLFLAEGIRPGPPLPKVLDFGLSKRVAANAESYRELTQHGIALGTPAYMAPEQLLNARDADVRCDVWAMGVVAYEMLACRHPFVADTLPALYVAVSQGHATPLLDIVPDAGAELAAAIHAALEPDLDARTPTARAFADALVRALGEPLSTEVQPIAGDDTVQTFAGAVPSDSTDGFVHAPTVVDQQVLPDTPPRPEPDLDPGEWDSFLSGDAEVPSEDGSEPTRPRDGSDDEDETGSVTTEALGEDAPAQRLEPTERLPALSHTIRSTSPALRALIAGLSLVAAGLWIVILWNWS